MTVTSASREDAPQYPPIGLVRFAPMPLDLVDLDAETRQQMLVELAQDETSDRVYLSTRLSMDGREQYAGMLREAFTHGDDSSLARALSQPGILEAYETAVRRGRAYSKRVPYTAAETMAEGEFNRYYLRALCRSVLAFGGQGLEVYRARPSRSPRPGSEEMIGQRIDAEALLADLREHPGVDTALGLPPGPNSGLSARHP